MTVHPTQRFTTRVENYVKYRPGYPRAILDLLRRECGLTPASVVADIGSGTGLSTKLFLANGNRVYGVEPNPEMREAGEKLLAQYPRFVSVAAPAEATTLDAGSADFVVAGQAFHWFDREQARAEFARILKPAGWAVLMWNERRVSDTLFLRNYERLLKTFSTDYAEVDHRRMDAAVLGAFFGKTGYRVARFNNKQRFDFDGVRGRLLSSSYAPEPGHPNYEPMLAELGRIFDAYNRDGLVTLVYDTNVYYGHLAETR
jgi:SAM-dependent methyltransferase